MAGQKTNAQILEIAVAFALDTAPHNVGQGACLVADPKSLGSVRRFLGSEPVCYAYPVLRNGRGKASINDHNDSFCLPSSLV